MRLPLALLAACLLVPGCIDGPQTPASAAASLQADAVPATTQVFDWTGHVVASEVETPTHFRPTEDAVWPVFQEGILFSVDEVPQALEVSRDWRGPGQVVVILQGPKE